MTNPEQPPYIQEMQQQMMNQSLTKRPGNGETNHRPQAQHTRCGHPNAARAWNTVHPTKERSRKTNSSKKNGQKSSQMLREMRSSVGILRKLELQINSPPHMDATCMEGTNLPLSPLDIGKASGQNTPLKITLHLQAIQQTQSGHNLGQEQQHGILRQPTTSK